MCFHILYFSFTFLFYLLSILFVYYTLYFLYTVSMYCSCTIFIYLYSCIVHFINCFPVILFIYVFMCFHILYFYIFSTFCTLLVHILFVYYTLYFLYTVFMYCSCTIFIYLVRPEKFQFLEKWQNRNFDYQIVISVKNPELILQILDDETYFTVGIVSRNLVST